MSVRVLSSALAITLVGTVGAQDPASPPGAAERRQLLAACDLKQDLGDEVWPGFGAQALPLILYDDVREVLVGLARAPEPWRRIEAARFRGEPVHWRPSADARAFAASVGTSWAGSIESLASMNRKMAAQVREELSAAAAAFVRPRMSRAEHAVLFCHETFHAYQATVAPDRFAEAVAAYPAEASYPLDDPRHVRAWNEEGRLLWEALRAEPEDRAECALDALSARAARREHAALPPDAVAFERHMEWLEGLAKYVELELAARAAARELHGHRAVWSRLEADFMGRLRMLGRLPGQHRFYLSGAAQARLLDALRPDWKSDVLADGATLEGLLGSAAGNGG